MFGKKIWLIVSGSLMFSMVNGQQNKAELDGRMNTITTAVPFLRIVPDARSGAMGDAGIALSPDVNSMHLNPSKYAFIDKKFGIGASFTPWLRALGLNDIYLGYLSAFGKIDEDQAIAGSLRYFSLGTIQFTDISGNNLNEGRPNEFAIDGAYSRKLSENFSTALALRFIYSNLATGVQSQSGDLIKPGTAFAGDVSAYYTNDTRISGKKSKYSFGANISNIGSKISYSSENVTKDFIPINLGLGSALEIGIDDYNDIAFAFDVNKLLVPTPLYDSLGTRIIPEEKSVPSGILGSFSDAPGGFKEEIRELMYSIGIEYWYDRQFAIRGGYFNEHSTKGNRKYFTGGLGLKYNVFTIYVSYLVPSSNQRNPLDNTLRFTLLFDFDALKGDNPVE